ncbi:MAG: hypothetical protein AB7Q01_14070 [Gammaproteobacteria bacterium]
MTRVTITAVIEIEGKHAQKIERRFHAFLDTLPAEIANVSVVDRTVIGVKGHPDGKQVSRQSAGKSVPRLDG